ncbi:siderophore biosynthesis protein IucC [Bdellovibrio sp. SKB1291214]|uniref:IucA/IucC family protein n=1 Tax=Bdellovibrio sp. SKB1291214 TaxID=1732569 RepID=UPI0020CDF107|nr:IucA/IucC family protein [Bdellovibrio sp. SKB1291214]UYL07615.1 siderophore biosynthesis protein IucC [Bdellovibrio sp. SKB1291214]
MSLTANTLHSGSAWVRVNQNLVAKSLQELSYEQILKPTSQPSATAAGESSDVQNYVFALQSGVEYHCQGWQGIWTDIKVQSDSIMRVVDGIKMPVKSAGQFFIDCQKETGMDDIILGNFLEEMHNTLFSDLRIERKQAEQTSEEMTKWSGLKIQSVLNGHPKLLLNKGRITWSEGDLQEFAPESQPVIRLMWLAIRKNSALAAAMPGVNTDVILGQSMDEAELKRFDQELAELELTKSDYVFVPVHPWQWDRFIQVQFAGELSTGVIKALGVFGDEYQPQISIRTLSNISRPGQWDIKLPVTILNTSSIRGIAAKYIPVGGELSQKMTDICAADPLLKNVQVLSEKAGVSFQHPIYKQVTMAPYRYHEYLGAIWRECAESKAGPGESAVLTGSFFHKDAAGNSLLGSYVKASGLTMSQWLRRYFEVVVVPLYHLQLKYGIGLVSHGQNIVLKLKDHAPVGLIIKDFQGDLRLAKNSILVEQSASLASHLLQLPRNYLIHDLFTGHFVTVLRFVSEVLKECDGYSEYDFYGILGEVLRDYLSTTGKNLNVDDSVNLLAEKMPRVLVNKVRFKIGYADSHERPVPMVGDELLNPLVLGLNKGAP